MTLSSAISMISAFRSRPDPARETDVQTRRLYAHQRVRLPSASGLMTTGRRTRSQGADEAMEGALRVGICLGAPWSAESWLERPRWKRVLVPSFGSLDPNPAS